MAISSAACAVVEEPIKAESANVMAKAAQKMTRVVAGALLVLWRGERSPFL